MIKRNLLLERDMLLFDPWDAIHTTVTNDIISHPEMITFRKNSGTGITLLVYGTIGTSDLTGKPVIEDMQVMLGDSDIYNALPEAFLQELTEAALEEQ